MPKNTPKDRELKRQRVQIIKNFLLSGNVRTRAVIELYAKEWGWHPDTIYHYFEEAREQIFSDIPTFKKEYKKIISGRLEELYDLTKQNGDFKESRQDLATLAKLWGLNEPDELKVTDTEIKFTFGDVTES